MKFFDNLQLSFIGHSIYLSDNKIIVNMKTQKYLIDGSLLLKRLRFLCYISILKDYFCSC